ncbi:hypothetical protein [Actinomadura meridiana]
MTVAPDVLSTSLNAIKSSQARRRPTIMIINAEDGTPRISVPDCGELRVLDDRHLRVAIWPDDPVATDLDRGAPVLLIVADSPDVHLLHAEAHRLDNAAMVWTHYDLTITSSEIAGRGTGPQNQPADTAPADVHEEVLTDTRAFRWPRAYRPPRRTTQHT